MGQLQAFASDGYIVVSDVVDEATLARLDAEVDALVDRDPPPAGKVGFHHYFRAPSELSASFRALREAGVLALAEELVAPLSVDLAVDHIQIATSIYGWEHEPGGGHIDGYGIRGFPHSGQIEGALSSARRRKERSISSEVQRRAVVPQVPVGGTHNNARELPERRTRTHTSALTIGLNEVEEAEDVTGVR